ncbi:MAG: hypothetical protein A2Y10_12200 [Planctomycetes bacterium GWF2_41_51]|nr:MAG: hypothetical protein A2Y10_12200 [Planctomycetes bacterium GWF2_41_51]
MLLEGGFLKEVYHSDDVKKAEFKQWVNLYHDRVKDAVRSINKIRAVCRMQGIKIPRSVIIKPDNRCKWLSQLRQASLSEQLNMLFIGYDAAAQQTPCKKTIGSLREKLSDYKNLARDCWCGLNKGDNVIRVFGYTFSVQ